MMWPDRNPTARSLKPGDEVIFRCELRAMNSDGEYMPVFVQRGDRGRYSRPLEHVDKWHIFEVKINGFRLFVPAANDMVRKPWFGRRAR